MYVQEIEMVISRLEEEAETTRSQTEKAAEARIKSVLYSDSVSSVHAVLEVCCLHCVHV